MEIASRAGSILWRHWQALCVWGPCSSLQRTPSSPSPPEPVASRRSSTHSAPKVIFWKRRLSTTTPIWRPSPRSRRLVLKIGALDSQLPLYWRPNLQQRKMEPSMARSHTSPHPLHPVDSGWPPIVSAVIHHASFERNVTRRDSLPPRGARHICIRAKELKRTPLYLPPPSLSPLNRE